MASAFTIQTVLLAPRTTASKQLGSVFSLSYLSYLEFPDIKVKLS